jgi:hypothetical protein
MKKIVFLAGVLFLAGAAHAQFRGGSLNSAGSLSSSHSSVYNNGSTASSSQANVSAKNPGEFVPSTFENYRDAVIIGQAELDAKPMTVAEAARVLQVCKKSGTQKAALVAEQDAAGKMIISPARSRADSGKIKD